MNASELLLIFIVALVVFGPKQLPMLAEHLGRFILTIRNLKEQGASLWREQSQVLQLRDHTRRAEEADLYYKNKSTESSTE